jgi:hypothetical protein
MLDSGGKRTECLDGIQTKQDAAFAQEFSDFRKFEPVARNEMAGSQGDEPGVFVNLPGDIARTDDSEAARIEQADFDILFIQG